MRIHLAATTCRARLIGVFAATLIACSPNGAKSDRDATEGAAASSDSAASPLALDSATPDSASLDSAFAALQQRGADPKGMGVDQYTSTHTFDALDDGGRIELTRSAADSAGVAQIRRHLQTIATAFAAGSFATPAFVHMGTVPGTAVMTAKRDAIAYRYGEIPGGGQVRIVTTDSAAVRAVHDFITFQRGEHRSSGHGGH